MAMVRLEPAGRAIVPDATPPATGILKIKAVGMSAAVTSATKVATPEADKSALSRSRASAGRRPPSVGSLKQDASPSVDTRASPSQSRLVRSTRRGLSGLRSRSWLRADSDSRGPSRPVERRANLLRAYARPGDESGSIHRGAAGDGGARGGGWVGCCRDGHGALGNAAKNGEIEKKGGRNVWGGVVGAQGRGGGAGATGGPDEGAAAGTRPTRAAASTEDQDRR